MKLLEFPCVRQVYEYDCGAQGLQSVLVYYGIEIREELIMKYAKTNSKEGTLIEGITHVLKKFGLQYNSRKMNLEEVKRYLDKGIPVFLLLQAWNRKKVDYKKRYQDKHWVVAIGYSKDKVFFADPYSFFKTFLSKEELEERWHSEEKGLKIDHHGIAVFGRQPEYDSKKIIPMK